MGDWRVLRRWNVSDGYHKWPEGHRLHGACDVRDGVCNYVVETHQDLGDLARERAREDREFREWQETRRKRVAEGADIRMRVSVQLQPPARPTFTIEVKYIAHSLGAGLAGWMYALTCDRVHRSGRKVNDKAGGFASKATAVEAAKERANGIAKAMEPTETITYTPEF